MPAHFLIESILFAIDGFEFGLTAVTSFVSFTTVLHVVVTILCRIIIIILILVYYFNPGVGNHNTVSVYVVGIVIILNQHIGCHSAALVAI
jgi:hypothetical protein